MKQLLEQDEVFSQLPDEIKKNLCFLSDNSKRFFCWFDSNKDKIRGKLKGQRDFEDKMDVLSELYVAAIVLKSKRLNNLIYEPDGNIERCPDFLTKFSNKDALYIEVRRIRKTPTEEKRDEFLDLLIKKAKEIPLNLALSFDISNIKKCKLSELDIYTDLINKMHLIIKDIQNRLENLESDFEEGRTIHLKEFCENFYINVYNIPKNKHNGNVHHYSDLYNCPISGTEYKKFGDIIFDKIAQLKENSRNIIFIHADNDSHEFEDLLGSISSIRKLITNDCEELLIKKKYNNSEDFLLQSKKLSGIYIITKSTESRLWINRDAEYTLTENMIEFFKEIRSGIRS